MSATHEALSFTRLGYLANDPDLMRAFYAAALGVDHTLEFQATAGEPDPRGAGLFHTAFLFSDRASLATAALRLTALGIPVQGASDHDVSEAIYLADPEGNGVEIYVDRPEDSWEFNDDSLQMGTRPLNLQDLIEQAGSEAIEATRAHAPKEPFVGPNPPWHTIVESASSLPPALSVPTAVTIGHVHLRSLNVEAAEEFWTKTVGLSVTTRYENVAGFLSAGGYHHHIGVNRFSPWTSRQSGAPGLESMELSPSADATLKSGSFTTPEGISVVVR